MPNTKTRTPIFSRHWPGFGYGYADIMRHPGSIFFVGSASTNAVDDTGHGRSPDNPFATLNYAIGNCTSGAGDVIYLLPNHVELVASAGALDLDVIGISIIGLGWGTIQPIIRFTLATADMDVDAAGITIENVNFQAGVADVLIAIDVNCADFTIRRCRFTEQGANLNALVWIVDHLTDSPRITVEDCFIYAPDSLNDAFIRYVGVGDGHVLRRNVAIGDWDNLAFAGGAGVITGADISDNYIYNTCTTADSCLSFAAGATGVMMGNMVTNGHATQKILATGMSKSYNYAAVIAEDLQGIPEPALG